MMPKWVEEQKTAPLYKRMMATEYQSALEQALIVAIEALEICSQYDLSDEIANMALGEIEKMGEGK